ncbi:hypothetical protein [Hoylesella shahii]|uniref:hypothetical protein n=1 Tax=Hoylesella shahii TaxID=228603 RepID=UPI0028E65D5B|nr:hypothetical protein [Hoylesella shahii]
MKTERQNSKLAMLTKDVEGKLATITATMQRVKGVMEVDYERFFRWHSEEAYRMNMCRFEYGRLHACLLTGDLDRVRQWLRQNADCIKELLLAEGARGYSVSASGLANVNALEAKRELRKQYLSMLDFIGNGAENERDGLREESWLDAALKEI